MCLRCQSRLSNHAWVHVYESSQSVIDRQAAHYVRWAPHHSATPFFRTNALVLVLIGKVKVLTERLTPYRSEAFWTWVSICLGDIVH